jgi:poly[(R)-3-hydroxyalkanoate] polymerase subunit PhaC
MFFGNTEEMIKRFSDSQLEMTTYFMNTSLDTFNKINPVLFSTELIDEWKDKIKSNASLRQNNINMFNDFIRLCQYTTYKSFGIETEAVITPKKSDRRFTDENWNEVAAFDYIKQFYLLVSEYTLKSTAENNHLDDKELQKLEFYTKQFLDALSPTNFAASNPAVIKETLDTNGKNLVNGAKALLDDLIRGKGKVLTPRMTDNSSFEVGKNVATTPGKVIFQNELMQLIQYTPTTKTVYETPLLIVPPWINKYYILDLRQENSFIQWAVNQGHSVFVISWVNPDKTYADTELEDYMTKGILTAIDKVKEETAQSSVNTIGYCIGGTLLAATNAYLASKRRKTIKSTTYFTTLIDFEAPGDLGIFIDEEQLDALDVTMEKEGFLDGTSMASVFNMLRSNDLIWPFFINNYLFGKEPTAFDLLYWNSDSTRLAAKAHSFYLRTCYLNNLLREPGGIKLADTAIDISKIKVPTYFISTHDDHITPWKSTYAGAQLLSGDVKFVLGGSGHIAGIINPPIRNKYGFWTNNTIEQEPDNWLENASYTEGSWWTDWQKWIKKHTGKKINARQPGRKLKAIEDAPGSYVKVRICED